MSLVQAQKPERADLVDISAVVPVYNEVENIEDLCRELKESLERTGRSYEIIIVDDGSFDGTVAKIIELSTTYPELRGVFLARNYGQSTAMQAGFNEARGGIVASLDGDLQNDPADIVRLIDVLESENVDVVSGWRKNRQDDSLRVSISRVANRLISRVTGVRLHDYGCSLKCYRRDLLDQIKVYGELHRFIPALAAEVGAEIREIAVNHRPRTRGKSKYKLDRTIRVALDLVLVMFMRKYIQRPLHFFGGIGFILGSAGLLICIYLAFIKLAYGIPIGDRPLLLLGISLGVSGLTVAVLGLLGEILVRLLHESTDRPQYRVKLQRKLTPPLAPRRLSAEDDAPRAQKTTV